MSGSGLEHSLNVTHLLGLLTGGGFAYGGVFGAEPVTLHAQTVEAAVRVDAALRARIGGGAFVYVDARLPVVFQAEAGVASALREGRAGVFSTLPVANELHCEISCGLFTLKPILRSSQSWEQPLILLFRHSLMKQLSSSEPSPQSSLRSQSSVSFTQLPLPQAYAVSLHFFSEGQRMTSRSAPI